MIDDHVHELSKDDKKKFDKIWEHVINSPYVNKDYLAFKEELHKIGTDEAVCQDHIKDTLH